MTGIKQLSAAALLCATACGSALPYSGSGAGHSGGLPTSTPTTDTTTSGGTSGSPNAGTLTAGIWDDNLNFARFQTYRDDISGAVKPPPFSTEAQAQANVKAQTRSSKASLDIALVIDTTSSMGDEIRYLQSELKAIAQALRDQYPQAAQRWAVVAYRDTGDEYVVKPHDFVSDLATAQAELGALSAGGGGDYPEAPDQALAKAATLSWNQGADVARLVFWVADAPAHDENAHQLVDAVTALQNADVHIYPVASSGVDELTEYTMRASAQLTLGRYLFLTDDSGVGDSHKTPSVACYWVTKLAAAMERAVASELEGTHVTVDPNSVIRSVGEPKDGVCSLGENTTAVAF